MAESKKNITVTLEVREIVYDIQNRTYLTGRSREAEDAGNYEAASHMQVSDDNENSYQIRRSISNAYTHLKAELAEYIDNQATDTDNLIDEAVDTDGRLTLTLQMPSNYNAAAADSLGAALHQYVVSRSIAEWFGITNKADSAGYEAQAAAAIDTARRALYKRQRPVRPVYQTMS